MEAVWKILFPYYDTQICETFHVQEATSPFFTELHQKYDSYSAENESFSIKTVREADLWRKYHLMQRLVTTLKLMSTDYSELFYPHRLMTC